KKLGLSGLSTFRRPLREPSQLAGLNVRIAEDPCMRNRHPRSRNRRGVIVVLFSVLLVVLVIILAFSIDVGYMYSVRTDLQRAVDAGALAAAGQLTNEPNKAEKTAKE